MVAPSCLFALAALLSAAQLEIPEAKRDVLLATAVGPLRVDKLADALRTYLDGNRFEVRTAPAVSTDDLRADVATTVHAGAGGDAKVVLRVAAPAAEPAQVEIMLSHLATERTVITTIPHSGRDEDLYRTMALKVQGLLRAIEEQPVVAAAAPVATVPSPGRQLDLQAGLTVVTFPLGDVTQEGVVLRGRWAVTEATRLGVGLRVLPEAQRKSGTADVRMRSVPLVVGVERFWRGSRFDAAVGLLVLAEARRAVASAGKTQQSDWDLVAGGGASLSFGVRLARAVRLSLQAAAIGLPWSARYQVGGVTVFDATRLEVPVDLTLDVAM